MLQVLLFVLASVLEVRVHASAFVSFPNEKSVTEEPAGCITESSFCAIKTRANRKFTIRIGESNITLGGSTIAVRLGAESFTVLSGEVWVEAENTLTLNSEYGQVVFGPGRAWVVKESDRVVVRGLGAAIKFQPRGSAENIALLEGFENWMGRVNKTGHAQTGIPKAIDFKDQVHRFARLYPGTKNEFRKELRVLHAMWVDAVEGATKLHQGIIDRTLASADEESRRREAARRAYEAETRKLNEIFRKKYEGEE